jgi:DNA-binding Lrp family transcriptional regulator
MTIRPMPLAPSSLRPQDVAVALQLTIQPEPTFAALAERLGISQGDAHNAVKRLDVARLVRSGTRTVAARALLDFLTHGVPHAFAAVLGPVTRGVATAHAGPPLARLFGSTDPVVWPSALGSARGASLAPLYPAAVGLPGRNGELYELLTLVDALRVGQARERKAAVDLLRERLERPAHA